ncbi:MAG: hypothetical protein OI74_04600 [Gammaproteobacteria bacterium (ex Lamellibrachia satsuma)]|nr:MAG: PKD domain-containing protein [Gammaproteobacteria bacterium (ex Lamellibrachia satsuma)]RRS34689.1 MAG: hypothetical protein OI74_04600 [Gammaproteobacteria bacterium (ex Lamellibrachia satsuma)]RRS35274.1 MAG: hypothetical protein NV67_10970 [Gammaproteobacteria bacterium (ex Lamellibrachia satsuma)]
MEKGDQGKRSFVSRGMVVTACVCVFSSLIAFAVDHNIGTADGSFESGFVGMVSEGDAQIVTGHGPLLPTQGGQAALLTSQPDSGPALLDVDVSRIRIVDFTVPAGATELRLDYNFLSNEPNPSYMNDRFTVRLLTPGGEDVLLQEDTFEPAFPSVWTGYERQTGFRLMRADVSTHASGVDLLTLEIELADDGDGRLDSAVFLDNLHFADADDPHAAAGIDYFTAAPNDVFPLSAAGSGDDGTIVSYAWDMGNGDTLVGPTPFYSYSQDGIYQVSLTVTDDNGNQGTDTLQIVVGDLGPTIVSSPVLSAAEGIEYNYQVTVQDPEVAFGDVLVYSLTGAPVGMSIDTANGLITWTPPTGANLSLPVAVRVEDSNGLSDTQAYEVSVGADIYMVATDDSARTYYARSNGDGTFQPLRFVDDTGHYTRGAAIADFDKDGDFDFVSGHGYSSPDIDLYYYEKEGDGFKAAVFLGSLGDQLNPAYDWPMDMAAEDFNGDGHMDFVVNGNSGNMWLLTNHGQITFGEEIFFESGFETGNEGWGGAQCSTTMARDDATAATGSWSMRLTATADGSCLSNDINPASWYFRNGSTVSFAYRIPPGVPAGLLFRAGNMYSQDLGWIYLGGSSTADGGVYDYPEVPKVTLIDDGNWHTISFDVNAAVKKHWSDAWYLTEFEWYTANNAVSGDQFWFDDFRVTRRTYESGFDIGLLENNPGSGRGTDAADVDHDGNMDFVRGNYSSGEIHLYRGDGAGGFTRSYIGNPQPSNNDPYGVVTADFDSDGIPDVIAVSGDWGDVAFFRGNGDGTFQEGVYVPSLDFNRHAAYGVYDFDNDGNQDIVSVDYNGRKAWYHPGNGDSSFGDRVEISGLPSNTLGVAAPAGRVFGQPYSQLAASTDVTGTGGSVDFDASDSTDDGTIVHYAWDFGDGTTGEGDTINHTFNGEGTFLVKVTITDDEGKRDRSSVKVTVSGTPPVADAGGPYHFGEEVALNGTWRASFDGSGSSDPESGIARYEWDFDDSDGIGVDATGSEPQHMYDVAGVYLATLTVYNGAGQSAIATATVTVGTGATPVPVLNGPAVLNESHASLGEWTGWFDIGASSDDNALAGYLIDWGDGNSEEIVATLRDDFDDGDFTANPAWTASGGTWLVENGRLHQTNTSNAWRYLQEFTGEYRDFELELDFRAVSTGDGYMGILFRSDNQSGTKDGFLMYSRNSWDFWRFHDWSTEETLVDNGSGWDPGYWYHLRLRVVGGNMKLYVTPEGGTESLQVEADDPRHTSGGIGLLSYAQSLVYDNVRITRLGSDARAVPHSYSAEGIYDIQLTATDHAGQSTISLQQVVVEAGVAPVADNGGPYELTEADAQAGRWLLEPDLTASTDDQAIQRFTIDFGDGTTHTTAQSGSLNTGYFTAGTDLYGYDLTQASLRIIAVEDDTALRVIDLATGQELGRNSLNRFGQWDYSPGDGVYFKVEANKPVVVYESDFDRHSAFVPSLDQEPVGNEFIFHRDPNDGFYLFAYADSLVRVFDTSDNLVAEQAMSAGTYWQPTILGTTRYRVVSSGPVSMQTTGNNGYTTVPSSNGSPVGWEFQFAVVGSTTGAVAAFAHEDADLEIIDMDSGVSLHTQSVSAGQMWYQNGLGTRRLRLVANGDVEVWAGDTEGGDTLAYLGDDTSTTTGLGGTDFLLHELGDGVVVFAPHDGTEVRLNGLLADTLGQDGYLRLNATDFSGTAPHQITASQPVVIQTLGGASAYNDLGTWLGGVSTRHRYTSPGTYDLSVAATDRAGQTDTALSTVTVSLGAPPEPVIAGPVLLDESHASNGLWNGTFDGSGSTDDFGIYEYEWVFNPALLIDDFAGDTLDVSRWIAPTGVYQEERIVVAGVGSWSNRYLSSVDNHDRTDGKVFQLQVRPVNLAGNQYGMWGLKNSSTSNFHYNQMPHAVYFVNGAINIYENGSNLGVKGGYTRGRLYDVRITLKTEGAIYEMKPADETVWSLLHETSTRTETPLKIGGTVHSGVFEFDNPSFGAQVIYGEMVEYGFATTGDHEVNLTVRDQALQSSSQTVTVSVEQGAPPVADVGGPYTAEVGSFIRFDGNGSSDDTAIASYHWDFGDTSGGPGDADLPYTSKGPNPDHFYRAAGDYPVTLTVTDNTGQTSVDTATVSVVTGDMPVALVTPPSQAGAGGPPAYFDASQSSDDYGIVEYRWDFDDQADSDGDGDPTNDIDAVGQRPFHTYSLITGVNGVLLSDDFEGASLDAAMWTSAGATQDSGVLSITGSGIWGQRYVYSTANFERERFSFTGTVQPAADGGTQRIMWGVKDSGTSGHYNAMAHAIYFDGGSLAIYENGSGRGTVGSYVRGTTYEVRIDIKGQGADYYIREAGAAIWTALTSYSSRNQSIAPLKIAATVSHSTATFDDFKVESLGGYVALLTVEDGAGQTSTAQVTVPVAPNLPPNVITVPWVAHDPLAPHETYNGRAIRLKGMVRDADPVEFQWDFGDGTSSAVTAVTNSYDLSIEHTYPDVPNDTPFVATLKVWDSAGQMGQDNYNIVVKPQVMNTEINVAIDEGLWYLHQTQSRRVEDGYDVGYWTSNARASATASALQAFLVNGHLETSSHHEDPYAETVMRGFRQLFRDLGSVDIAVQTYGEPDTNGNGIGIQTGQSSIINGRSSSSGGQPIYQGGQVMDAIASSGTPLARSITGGTNVNRRAYFDILTDMADQYAWGQTEQGSGGGWRYGWNNSIDNSAAQWGAVGLLAAEDVFGIPVSQWVKERNLVWLGSSFNGTGFGYTAGGTSNTGAPSGLVQLILDGMDTASPMWRASENWIAENWQTEYIKNLGNRPYYPYYALTKSMRLAQPGPVEQFALNGFDWFNDPELGIARTLVDDQSTDGSFPGSEWVTAQLRSAWGVIILSRSLFVQPPVADAGRDRTWAVDRSLTLDGSGSFHLDPFRSIVKYEWDFDGDGTFDHVSSEPTVEHIYASADYPESSLPQTITVTLRVTDNNVPALTSSDSAEITISIPPRPPVADVGGPYTCTQGIACQLDGSASFDLDEPHDFIVRFGWELDLAEVPRDFDDATGATAQHTFIDLGTFDIGLKVWDNGFLNDIDGDGEVDENERKTDQEFTRATVVENLGPSAVVGGPYTVDEGDDVVLNGSGADPNGDSLVYLWDLDDDGGFGDATGQNPNFNALDDGIYPIHLQVSDSLLADAADTTVTVNNVSPTVDAGADQSVEEGESVNFSGTFSDPGSQDTHSFTWDFGDGSSVSGSLTPSHSFPEDGTYTVTLTVTDDDGGVGTDTLTVSVSNAVPLVDAGPDQTTGEGDTTNFAGSFTDPGTVDTHTYEWDFGDGSATVSGSLTPSHTFVDNGTYTVTLTVTDSDGGVGNDTLIVAVNNAAPSVEAGSDQAINEGDTASFSGSFTDPGTADTHSFEWNFGDGSAPVSGSLISSHVYTDNGVYTVTLTVIDKDGGVGSDTLTVTVSNVAPVVTVPAGQTTTEGGTVTLPDATFNDVGTGDTHTATVDWGDGTVDNAAVTQGAGNGSVALGSHGYAEDGIYTATVSVTDDDGTVGSNSLTISVSNARPVVEAGPNQGGAPGDTINLAPATFTDAGVEDTHTASIDWGDGTIEAGTVTQGAGSGNVAGSHVYAADGSYTVTVTVTDDEGASASDNFQVNLSTANVRPTAGAGGPYTTDEGGTVTFDGSGSSDPDNGPSPLSYAWDLDGDGQYDDATGVTVILPIQPDNTSFTVGLQVSDGLLTATDTATVTVNNVAPTANAGPDQTANEGNTANFAGSFTDPGTVDTHTIEWNFGDGSAPVSGSLTPSHTYADNGVYTVTLTVTDKDGGMDTDTLTVTVGNVAPVVAVPTGQTITEGDTVTLPDASFTDAGTGDTHTATIDWGDGTAELGTVTQGAGNGSVALGNHIYAEDGIYTVTVSVTDDDGTLGSNSLTISVSNARPVVEAGPNQGGAPGDTINLAPATFTDAGVEDTHTATIDWGDGTTDAGTVTQGAGNGSVAGSHTYAADGNYTVTVTVTDDDGLFGSDSFQVILTTANVGPTANAGGPYTINEGQGVTLDGSASNDPDSGPSPLSYAWDLDGDGQYDDATGVTVTLPIQPDNSSFTVGLQVSDGLLTATDTATVTVNNVAPTANAGPDQTINEGGSASFSGSFSDPGSVDTHTIEWNFGDGSAPVSGSLTPSHTYLTAGVYTVRLTVTDKDGGVGSDTLTVTVQAGAVQTIFNLSARPKSNEVFLTWAPVAGADSYNIYRSTTSGGPYAQIASGHVCDYCAYYNPGLTNGVTYYYVVTSVKNGSESLSSNEASATPQARSSRSRR